MVFEHIVTKDSVVFEGRTYPLYDEKVYRGGKLITGYLIVGQDMESSDHFCYMIQYNAGPMAEFTTFGTDGPFCKTLMQGIDRPSYVLVRLAFHLTKNILGKSKLFVKDGAWFRSANASLYMLFKRGVSFYEAMGFREEDDGPERRQLVELVRRIPFKDYFDDLKPRHQFFVWNLLSQFNLLDYAATESLADVHLHVIDALNVPITGDEEPYHAEDEPAYERYEMDEEGEYIEKQDTRTDAQYENSLAPLPRWEHLLFRPYHIVGRSLSNLVLDKYTLCCNEN